MLLDSPERWVTFKSCADFLPALSLPLLGLKCIVQQFFRVWWDFSFSPLHKRRKWCTYKQTILFELNKDDQIWQLGLWPQDMTNSTALQCRGEGLWMKREGSCFLCGVIQNLLVFPSSYSPSVQRHDCQVDCLYVCVCVSAWWLAANLFRLNLAFCSTTAQVPGVDTEMWKRW